LAHQKRIDGRVNVPDGRELPLRHIRVVGCRPPGANLPTQRVLASTCVIMDMLKSCQRDDLVIGLFTGGGSALLECPIAPVSLEDIQAITTLLSLAGAPIEELNLVRSQLSQVKAGGLARLTPCRRMVSLLISDVLGDPISAIASGPMSLAGQSSLSTARQQAKAIISRYDPGLKKTPAAALRILDSRPGETQGNVPDVSHHVLANNQLAVQSAFEQALARGYAGTSETDFSATRIDELAQRLLLRLKKGGSEVNARSRRGCFISGGEPTVDVSPRQGLGGRNQHLVLTLMEAVLTEKQSNPRAFADIRFCFLSAGTDGEDGNVPVAGASFDSELINRIDTFANLQQVRGHLLQADSFTLLEQLGCILRVGDTRTNVCDLRVLLWEKLRA